MENCQRLAPPISLVSVKSVNEYNTFEIQVTPSIKNLQKYINSELYISPLTPFEVRRKYEDFKMLHKFVTAASVSISFPSSKGQSSSVLLQHLQDYLDKIFLLPKEILDELPVKKFFGEWSHDNLGSRPSLLPKPLVNKIGAMISLGLDTKDDVLANILKIDDKLRTDADQISKSDPHQDKSKSLAMVPTYEEFVAKLASSLSVDLNEGNDVNSMSNSRNTSRNRSSRDTVISDDQLNARMSTRSIDTVLSASEFFKNSIIHPRPLSPKSFHKSVTKEDFLNGKSIQINTKKSLTSSSPQSGSYIFASSIVIPSRKESRNWTDSSLSSSKSDGKIHYRITSEKDMCSPSPSSACSQNNPNPNPFDSKPAVSGDQEIFKPKKSNQILTLKIIPVSGTYTTFKVSRTIHFNGLLEKLCLIVGVRSMDLFYISYRTFDTSELIFLVDHESWNICKGSVAEDRLSIFINPK